MSEEKSCESHQLLVGVIDINPHQLLFARHPGSLTQLLTSLTSLLCQHLMLHPTNMVALLAAHSSGTSLLYPDLSNKDNETVLRQQDGQYEVFYNLETVVKTKVGEVMGRQEKGQGTGECLLSGAMAKAMCYINKLQSDRPETEKLKARLLVLSSTGDTAAQYINFMNVFFSAQKFGIPVDVCMLLADSGLLQQGSDITGGLYVKVEQLGGLLQYLTWLFLPGPGVRQMLGAPPPVKVDYRHGLVYNKLPAQSIFCLKTILICPSTKGRLYNHDCRAACNCHRQLVDIGFVCSVCLSIYCRFNPVCTNCHSVFKTQNPPTKKKKVAHDGAKK